MYQMEYFHMEYETLIFVHLYGMTSNVKVDIYPQFKE